MNLPKHSEGGHEMKKTLAILLIAVLTPTLFAACDSMKVAEENDSERILGRWEVTGYTGDSKAGYHMMGETYEFRNDGTYIIEGMGSGTYEIKGDGLHLNDGGVFKLSFLGDTMQFTDPDGVMTLTRR